MRVRHLSLESYRNFPSLDLSLHPRVNLLVGPNAQGKSTLLEAICWLAVGKAIRAAHEEEVIAWEAPQARVKAEVEGPWGSDLTLEARVVRRPEGGGRRQFLVQGHACTRLTQFLGLVRAVYFSPRDLDLIQGAPRQRRRFLDMALCQTSPRYLEALQRYQKALAQRNAWLRSGRESADAAAGAAWEEELVQYGAFLMDERTRYVSRLAAIASTRHQVLGGTEPITLFYAPCLSSGARVSALPSGITAWRDALAGALASHQAQDRRHGHTGVGPHRDDLALALAGHDVRAYGSQGEQRTAALALVLAQGELLSTDSNNPCLILLDDAFSELDSDRQERLWSALQGDHQVLVTAAQWNSKLAVPRDRGQWWTVDQGEVLACLPA